MAATKPLNFKTILNNAKQWGTEFKKDPKLQAKIRTIVLCYLVGICLLYVGYTFKIAPLQKVYNRKNLEYLAIKNSTPDQLTDILSRELKKVEKQEEDLKTKASILQLQNDLLNEMWQNVADEQIFFQVVLSLLPTAPTSLDQGMAKLNQLPPLQRDKFKIFPLSIDGKATYTDLFNYVQYLENRREVGLFDKFTLRATDPEKPDSELNFSIQVGRIQLDKESL